MKRRRIADHQARRIALAAQGFADPRPRGRVDVRHLRRVLDRVGLIQLDSVNVATRAHYVPIYSRLGPYPRDGIDRLAYDRRELFEYWGHEASLIPIERYPLFRHRMAAARPWGHVRQLLAEGRGYLESVLDEVRRVGPLTAGGLSDPGGRTGPWWGYSRGKAALEWHFMTGDVTVARRENFTRFYDVPDRVIPAPLLNGSAVPAADAQRELLRLAVRHHGIGTVADLADYYRIRTPVARPILAELAAAGEIEEVDVDGWTGPVYLDPGATCPRTIRGGTLLCPFDPLIWCRPRTERLFGFHYRIEIYVPEPRRKFGYYVFPFLLDGELVARVDLKADRATGTLLVRGAFVEADPDRGRVAGTLAAELRRFAAWLELGDVRVGRRGALAGDLRRALR